MDPVLGPVMALGQPWGLIIVSVVLTLLSTLAYKYLTDQKQMGELKAEMKSLTNEAKTLKDQPEKAMEHQKKAMEKQMKYMMQSFKPMLFTLIPILLVFGWLRAFYDGMGNPAILFGLKWIWAYLIFMMASSLILRKVLKVH